MVKGRLVVVLAAVMVAMDSDCTSVYFKQPYGVIMCNDLCRRVGCTVTTYIAHSLACDLRILETTTRHLLHQTKGHDTVGGKGNGNERRTAGREKQRQSGAKTEEHHTATASNSSLTSTTATTSPSTKLQTLRLRVTIDHHIILSMTPSMTNKNFMYLLTRSKGQFYIKVIYTASVHLITYMFELRSRRRSKPVQLYSGTCIRDRSKTCLRVLYVDRRIYAAALKEDPRGPYIEEDRNMLVLRIHNAPTFCFSVKSSEEYCLNSNWLYKLECTVDMCVVNKISRISRLPFSATDVKIDPSWSRVVTVTKYGINDAIFDHDKETLKNSRHHQIKYISCGTVAAIWKGSNWGTSSPDCTFSSFEQMPKITNVSCIKRSIFKWGMEKRPQNGLLFL